MKRIFITVLIFSVLLSLLPQKEVQAAAGAPGSPEFGYGAWLHLEGRYFQESLNVLSELKLDWIAINLDWSRWMPDSSQPPDLTSLDMAIQNAAANGMAVMISLTNPPSWATTPQGPDSGASMELVAALAARYPGILQAVELFPGANTISGWRSTPDPAAYAQLYSAVKSDLRSKGFNLVLVAGGLRPVDPSASNGDWNDLDFLRGLYTAGAAQWMDVIGLQFSRLTGSPLSSPSDGQNFVLRHYETVRQIMLENNHQSGLIWITQLCAPDGTINSGDKVYIDPQRQAEWLQQSAIQVRSQLYMGVAFIQNINPAPQSSSQFGKASLILDPDSVHPFYTVLKAIIQQTHPENPQTNPGRPKGNSLLKCKYKT